MYHREAYIQAWAKHSDDLDTIQRIIALCADLPRGSQAKPHQIDATLAAPMQSPEPAAAAAAASAAAKEGSRRRSSAFRTSVPDTTGRITDRFEVSDTIGRPRTGRRNSYNLQCGARCARGH